MLSIQPLKSASSACDYYLKAYEYYQGDATAATWLGLAKQYLNLDDTIEKDTMLDLLQGKLPDGNKLQNMKGEHRPGFDMTFSAPKSVSLLVGLGAAPQLMQFHDDAVKHAITQIEKEFAQARCSIDGEMHYEKTGNLLVAAFRQLSSRANDPALHTHCVTLNLTFLDGFAKSLASDKLRIDGVVEQIQNNAHYCGLLYRHHLANSLKEAGFTLRFTGNGLFELEGVPEEVLHEFSRRRADIEQTMEEKGWTGGELASKATLMTRPGKEEHDIPTLQEDWHERAAALEFKAAQFMQQRDERIPTEGILSNIKSKLRALLNLNSREPTEPEAARACVDVAIETLSQRTSVFNERTLKAESMKHSLIHDGVISEKAIVEAIEQEKKTQNLYVAYCDKTKQTMLTTPWLLTMEAESLTRIENNKGVMPSVGNAKQVAAFQKDVDARSTYQMTASQKEAMRTILTSRDRYLVIQGYAGVAKTTMLNEARGFIETQGYQLRGITVASSAAIELQMKAGIKADVFPVVHQELKNAIAGSLHKTIFIVDEASMLSSPQGHELIKRVESTGARLVLVGDQAQLPTVNNGRLFGLTQEYGIETAVMNEIVRQKNPEALAAVMHATRGEVKEAINKLHHVEELATHDERISWIANHWLSLTPERRKETLLFAPTHANREAITTLLRAGLEKKGTLKGDAHCQIALKAKSIETVQLRFVAHYQRGDVLRFNQDIPQNKIEKGQYYTVGQIMKNHRRDNVIPLINKEGGTHLFALKNLPQYKTHTAAFERVVEVYQAKKLELKVGDQVMWCRNFKTDAIQNGQRATLASIGEEGLVFTLIDGKSLTLHNDHPALKHLDYGYVLTNYKAQGKDAPYGVGLMESNQRFSATLKNFYVQISRAVYGMTLVTDDKELLTHAIRNNSDEKKSSLDMVSSHQLQAHENRFMSKGALSIQPLVEMKIKRELGNDPLNVRANNRGEELTFSKQLPHQNQVDNATHPLQKTHIIKELER